MTKKVTKPEPESEFALNLKRQRAADAMLASGQGVTTLTQRRIVEIIEQQERARRARAKKPSR